MTNVIRKFDEKSRRVIDSLDEVKDFKMLLDEKKEEIHNFKYNKSVAFKILHPVSLVKNIAKSLQIKHIESNYNNIYNSTVLQYVTEETGDLQVDLDNATEVIKPNYVKSYIKSLKIKK